MADSAAKYRAMVLWVDEPEALPQSIVLNPSQFSVAGRTLSLAGSPPVGVSKAADTSRPTNAVASADPDLTLVLAQGRYIFEGFLSFTAAGAGGLKAQLFASQALATSRLAWVVAQAGSTTMAGVLPATAPTNTITSATQMDNATGNAGGIVITGQLIIPSQTTIAITWAQQTSNATPTVIEAGSWIEVVKLA